VTKSIHNALQGADIELTEEDKAIYEEVAYENSLRMHIDHDVMIVHDPQPLPLIYHLPRAIPSIWCCHVDLSAPNRAVWDYLRRFIEKYHGAVFSLPEYAQALSEPEHFIMPAINPFALTNKELTEDEIDDKLAEYEIPDDLPLVVQISRFDKWKDPLGVVEAYRIAAKDVGCRLVLLGNTATDDPEGKSVFEACFRCANESIYVLSVDDALLVNALQRRATVVVQKSLREGFGLTVAESMWKGTPVIGGNVGGIRHQIVDGKNGFLVESIAQTAERIVRLVENPALRARMGKAAVETVRRTFLMTRLMEDWLDLISLQSLPAAGSPTRSQENPNPEIAPVDGHRRLL
jgi:trehalose synthase